MRKEEYSVWGHPNILRGQHTKSQLGVHHWNFRTPSTSFRTLQTQFINEDLWIYLMSCGKLIYSIRAGARYIFSMLAYSKSTILLYERIEVHYHIRYGKRGGFWSIWSTWYTVSKFTRRFNAKRAFFSCTKQNMFRASSQFGNSVPCALYAQEFAPLAICCVMW